VQKEEFLKMAMLFATAILSCLLSVVLCEVYFEEEFNGW